MRADNPFLINITHDQLVNYIKENTLTILGEEIHLDEGAIRGTWDALFPNMMGTDAQGRTVIVEAKTNLDDDSMGSRDAIHKSVGQIINYAAEYTYTYHKASENLRLFIVGPTIVPQLQLICHHLTKHGINIRHVSIHQEL